MTKRPRKTGRAIESDLSDLSDLSDKSDGSDRLELPEAIRLLAERAVRSRPSGIETARALEALAVDGADVSNVFEHNPELVEREFRAALADAADLLRALDRMIEAGGRKAKGAKGTKRTGKRDST